MKKLLGLLAALSILVAPARATWSIVVTNPTTGEVAAASATCVKNYWLEKGTPVLVVGRGVATAQSWLDVLGSNRLIIWNGLHAGWTAEDVLDDVVENGTAPHQRQYGIASFSGPAATYSGARCGEAVGNITGEIDGYHYAIQGNVLAGEEVAIAMEDAFRQARGDLSQRIMVAMEAARAWGGDGRCSCHSINPTQCGSPPPDFEKSAHCGYVLLARLGDSDGDCEPVLGCATGDYYLRISVSGNWTDEDPVFALQKMYDDWRTKHVGRPDHLLSEVSTPAQSLPADGHRVTWVTVRLVDVDGSPLIMGGAELSVVAEDESLAAAGEVVDHGDGTYAFPITAGLVTGTTRFTITVDDGVRPVQLHPPLELRIDPVSELHCGRDVVAVTEDTITPLTLNLPGAAQQPYLIACSASGTDPGLDILPGLILPLNPDIFLWRSVYRPNNAFFRNTSSCLDGNGRAEGAFLAPPGLLQDVVGRRLDWAALYLGPELRVTNVVGFEVVHDSL
jgi:hypothetical protein